MKRKTKIIATLGPATGSPEAIASLIKEGVNVFRFNMTHAQHEWVRRLHGIIRDTSDQTGVPVATLMDLQGPSIRTGTRETSIELLPGDRIEFRNEDLAPMLPISETTNYDGLWQDVKEGSILLVDNGVMTFEILDIQPGRLWCRALSGGSFGSRRHINLPGVRLNFPALTEKDFEDLELAAELKVDFVAISFVRDAAHVEALREFLQARNSEAAVVAKIEDQEAVRQIDPIIAASDVVMVARGDLGIECPIEELPIIQRRIVKRCQELGRRVIVATHMLESMIENPMPTRAEVTDVANAVYEQADAVMLSGETTVGKYPFRCVENLHRIACRTERSGGVNYSDNAVLKNEEHKTVKAAVVLANSMENSALIVFTRNGGMAHYASQLRPRKAPIFAFAPTQGQVRRLLLDRAIIPLYLPFSDDPHQTIEEALSLLRERGDVHADQPLVLLSDVLSGARVTDSILLRRL